MALHGSRKTLTDRGADHIDPLADDEVIGAKRGADIEQRIGRDAELDELGLGFDLGLGEVAALGLGQALDLGLSDAELKRVVTVALGRAAADHLTVLDFQNRDRDMATIVGKESSHAHLARHETGPHPPAPTA